MGELLPNRGWQVKSYWDSCESMWSEKLQDQVLEDVRLEDECIKLKVNGTEFQIWDNGQSCCEYRYITTDDDLPSFTGATLQGVVEGEYRTVEPDDPDECGEEHDVSFLRIYTSKGVMVFETHVEHNGYYGGFNVQLREA